MQRLRQRQAQRQAFRNTKSNPITNINELETKDVSDVISGGNNQREIDTGMDGLEDKLSKFQLASQVPRVITADDREEDRDLEDYSDIMITEQQIRQLLNPNYVPIKVVDLDTAPDYVEFIKTANANMLASENEFNTEMTFNDTFVVRDTGLGL